MNKIAKILLATIGACSVVMDLLTPLVIVLFLTSFSTSATTSTIIIIIGGLASIFRGIKVGWMKDE